MKITIAGSGAMGCRFGAALFAAGHEVLLLDGWAEHVAAINRAGLRVTDEAGPWALPVPASQFPATDQPCTPASQGDDWVPETCAQVGSSSRMRVPPPRAGFGRHLAAVAERDLVDDGEAEPGAGSRARRERAVEAVEDERQVVGGYAGAVVAHGELAIGQPDFAPAPRAGRTWPRCRAGS